MEKFNKFVETYEGTQYDQLPKFMKRRVDALKKLQLEHIKIQHQYNIKIQELELEFEKLHKPLYELRAKIVSGDYEPTDEECQLPAHLAENEFNGDQENAGEKKTSEFNKTEESELASKVKGLPGFWLGCLSSTYNISDSIEDTDRAVLKHLNDIQLSYGQTDDLLSYKLEFHFDENPFFTNKVLTKTYYLKANPDEKNPFSYEGFEVSKSEGCEIDWKAGKDITMKTVTVKQRNKSNGQTRQKQKVVENDSFFYFFKPPQLPEGEDDIDEELGAIMAVDFELGELIRQSLIPKAALYYNGFMIEDEDEEDDDEDGDDDDDSDGAEYDSDDMLDSESDSHESTDSLVKKEKAKWISKFEWPIPYPKNPRTFTWDVIKKHKLRHREIFYIIIEYHF